MLTWDEGSRGSEAACLAVRDTTVPIQATVPLLLLPHPSPWPYDISSLDINPALGT